MNPELRPSSLILLSSLPTALVKAVEVHMNAKLEIALDTSAFSSWITEALISQLHLKQHFQ